MKEIEKSIEKAKIEEKEFIECIDEFFNDLIKKIDFNKLVDGSFIKRVLIDAGNHYYEKHIIIDSIKKCFPIGAFYKGLTDSIDNILTEEVVKIINKLCEIDLKRKAGL